MCSNHMRMLLLLLVSALLAPAGKASTSNVDNKLLHGKVETHDRTVRLARPKTPMLETAVGTSGGGSPVHRAIIDFGDMDFSKQGTPQPLDDHWLFDEEHPKSAPASQSSSATKAEDKELIIAWEAWHKRVCSAIYQNWLHNSKILGVAHTTIRITRDRRISVTVHEITLAPEELESLPPGLAFAEQKLQDEFSREINASVDPLNGSEILTFPEKSQRQEMVLHPYFKKSGEAGYDWRTDDFERVHIN